MMKAQPPTNAFRIAWTELKTGAQGYEKEKFVNEGRAREAAYGLNRKYLWYVIHRVEPLPEREGDWENLVG